MKSKLMEMFNSVKRTKVQALIVAAVMKVVIFLQIADAIGYMHRVYFYGDINELTAGNTIFDASLFSFYWFLQTALFFLVHRVSWEYGHMATHDDYEKRISAEKWRASKEIERHGLNFRHKVEVELRNRGIDAGQFFASMRENWQKKNLENS